MIIKNLKEKTKKIRNCAVCEKELNDDNLGKYCGEICKKEGMSLFDVDDDFSNRYVLYNT